MIDLGFIVLRYAKESKKIKEIFLTPEGVDFSEKTADKIIEAERRALSILSEKEQDVFIGQKYMEMLRNKLSVFRETEATE